jgi:hypothetical protein
MEVLLKLSNVESSVLEVVHRMKCQMPMATSSQIAADIYDYAIGCKHGASFDERASYKMIAKYCGDNDEMAKELWAVLAMYSFENSAFQIVKKFASTDPESAVNNCYATLIDCARHYDPDKCRFSTYAFNSMVNNVRRDNRSEWSIHIPDKLARQFAFISDHMDMDNAEIAKKFGIKVRNVKTIKDAIVAQNVLSMDEKYDGDDNDGCTIGMMMESKENVVDDYCERESESNIQNNFLPIIADIYGHDFAFVVLIRTGIFSDYEGESFYNMEEMFSMYLITRKKLTNLAEELPHYAKICEALKYQYAVKGVEGVREAIKHLPEEYLFRNLLAEAAVEAKELCANSNRKSCDCFKPAGSLNYMYSKIFPTRNSPMSDADKRLSARFRKELRDRGMDQIANALRDAEKL